MAASTRRDSPPLALTMPERFIWKSLVNVVYVVGGRRRLLRSVAARAKMAADAFAVSARGGKC